MSINILCDCIIEHIIAKPFSQRSIEEKNAIIKTVPPKPPMTCLKGTVKQGGKTINREFNIQNYNRCDWLIGCEAKRGLFCWPCLLFKSSTDHSTWVFDGYKDLNHLSFSMSTHEKSKTHINSMLCFKSFGKERVDLMLDKQKKEDVKKFNEVVKKNREIFKRLVDVVALMGRQEMSFRGHDEQASSDNRGNYLEMLEFLSIYDPVIYQHFQESTIFKGTSSQIQNDVIHSISSVLLDLIKAEINDAQFISVMLDETTDISLRSQLSTMIRYVSATTGEVHERFISFSDISSNRGAEAISNHIIKVIQDLKCENKIIGQAYDGAAVMAGELNGAQARVRRVFPAAKYIHCSAHKLNLVLSNSVTHIKECKIFFATLSGIPTFFSHSTKRSNHLEEFMKKKFPSISSTRWNYSSRLVNTVKDNRKPLVAFFESIIDDPSNWDNVTIQVSKGFIHFLEEFNTVFLLEIFSKVFAYTDVLYDVLQNKNLDISFCNKFIHETINNIALLRSDANFEEIFNSCKNITGSPNKGRKSVRFDRLFFEILDTLKLQMEQRFENFKDLEFVSLLYNKKFPEYKKKFPTNLINLLKTEYPKVFDFTRLCNELSVIYSSEIYKDRSIPEFVKYNVQNGLTETFSESQKLACLILTLPSTTASVERSFSCLKRIKTYCRNSMSEERLSSLAIISIEKRLLKNLISGCNEFYDKVIEDFTKKDRRIDLIYK